MKNSRGFTLIELIAVVAIIAILAAVILPNVFGQIRKARVSRNLSEADDIRNGALQYFADVGNWPVVVGTNNAAIDELLAGTALPNWRGPYMDKAPRTGGGFYNSQYAGCMFLDDEDIGDGDDSDINRNAATAFDRFVLLGNVPNREANDTDLLVDGAQNFAAGAVVGDASATAAIGGVCGAPGTDANGDWANGASDATLAVLIIISEGT